MIVSKRPWAIRDLMGLTALAAVILAAAGLHVALFLGAVCSAWISTSVLRQCLRIEGTRVVLACVCVASWLSVYALSIGPCSLLWTYLPESIRRAYFFDFHMTLYRPLFALHEYGILVEPIEWYTGAWMHGRQV